MRLDLARVSSRYSIRQLEEADVPDMLKLCKGNPLYYQHMKMEPTLENLAETLTDLPPDTSMDDKYSLGYYQEGTLIGLLDLMTAYPDKDTAYIGWFMLHDCVQGEGTGTAIITELLAYLKAMGFQYAQLGYIKSNPQPAGFWRKNKFVPTGKEAETDDYTVVVMQRQL